MCVSSRRRPITSPPGGGTVARPKRASSGPASRNDARISRQSSGSSSHLCTPEASTRTSFGPVHVASAPMSTSSSTIVSTSRMRGTFSSVTGSGGQDRGGEDRKRAVLVARGAHRSRTAACRLRSRRTALRGGIVPPPWRSPARGPGTRSRATRRASRCGVTRSRSRRRSAGTPATTARTRRPGGAPPCSTTSTTRSTPRSTSIRRTAPRSSVRRAIRSG